MRAVIVGGGVAGPATALALGHVGVETVVLERRGDRNPTEGSYFTVAPNGLDALQLLGALDLAREVGFPTHTNAMYGATGRLLGEHGRAGLVVAIDRFDPARGLALRAHFAEWRAMGWL